MQKLLWLSLLLLLETLLHRLLSLSCVLLPVLLMFNGYQLINLLLLNVGQLLLMPLLLGLFGLEELLMLMNGKDHKWLELLLPPLLLLPQLDHFNLLLKEHITHGLIV